MFGKSGSRMKNTQGTKGSSARPENTVCGEACRNMKPGLHLVDRTEESKLHPKAALGVGVVTPCCKAIQLILGDGKNGVYRSCSLW